MKDFLEIDTATNAIDSLLRAEEFIRRVESEGNPLLWKWIIICLHHSLYTFSIIVAAGTNRINVAVFNKKHMKKMFVEYEDEYETTGKKTYQPDYGWIADNIYSLRLVDFLTAVKRACAANPFIHLELTGNQKNSILYLRDYRNSLEHFEPKNHLGIGLHRLLNICVEILEIIRCLALPSNSPLGPIEKLDVLKKMEKSSSPLSPEEKNFFSPSHGTGPGEARSKKDKVEESINASIRILRSSRFHCQDREIPDHPRLSEWTEE